MDQKHGESGIIALRARKKGKTSKDSLLPWQMAQIPKVMVE